MFDLREEKLISFGLSIKMNTSIAPPNNFCVLPSQHSHAFENAPTSLLLLNSFANSLLAEEQEDLIISQLILEEQKNNQIKKQEENQHSLLLPKKSNNQEELEESYLYKNYTSPREPSKELVNHNGLDEPKSFSKDNQDTINKAASISTSSREKNQLTKINKQELDPYIDAVQVKNRINNKRGARVRAAAGSGPSSNQQQQQETKSSLNNLQQQIIKNVDHEPKSSYYSKTVHIEESKEDDLEWDYSDYDDDDHGGHDHYHDKNKKKKKKKVYVKKYPKKKKKKMHHKSYGGKHYDDEHYHHDYHHKGKKYPKKKKKVTGYAYVQYEPKKGTYYYHHGHHGKNKHGKHSGYEHHYDEHDHDHDYHHHKGKKAKIVHLDMIDKGKWSVAGLLGYTLLCVNYLMVLQAPTYDKYSGHYYTKYSQHGGKGEIVKLKSGGPVILAHCQELSPTAANNKQAYEHYSSGLMNEANSLILNKTIPKQPKSDKIISTFVNNNNTTNATTSLISSSSVMEPNQQAATRLHKSAAHSPPSYYYTLAPSSFSGYSLGSYNNHDHYGSSDYYGSNGGGSDYYYNNNNYYNHRQRNSLFAPIQNVLNKLLLPTTITTTGPDNYGQLSDNFDYSPIQVLGGPQRARVITTTNGQQISRNANGQQLGNRALIINRAGLGGNGRLVLVDGQPQVIGTKDNLIDLRTRNVDIQMRVIRERFGGPQRAMNLMADIDPQDGWRGRGPTDNLGVQLAVAVRAPLGLAGRGPPIITSSFGSGNLNNNNNNNNNGNGNLDELPQSDQPNQQQQQQSLGNLNNNNNQILDLPEYALTGDSIQLTCNHRIPIGRLYSVKWFKDSLEFYRFIPANGPRTKTSLFLPEVRLDLARSDSDTLYLRNVTHRTSGQYRCEAVSEGPNFETMSGEKRMQVYSLPDSGPQLSLMDEAQLAEVTPPPLAPLQIQTTLPILNNRQLTNFVNVGGTTNPTRLRPGGALERENEDDDDNNDASGRTRPRLNQNNNARNSPLLGNDNNLGPIIRCQSSRSNPVAQLRFFINDQAIELSRTLENSTTSYSDGLESNVVSFRLALNDFIMRSNDADADSVSTQTNGNNSPESRTTNLLKAASLKLQSEPPSNSPLHAGLEDLQNKTATKTQQQQSGCSTTTTTTTTTTTSTTTTSTTPKPKTDKPYANANVQFDDQNVAMKKSDFKISNKKLIKETTAGKIEDKKNTKKAKKKKSKKKSQKEKQTDAGRNVKLEAPTRTMTSLDDNSDAADNDYDYDEQSSVLTNVVNKEHNPLEQNQNNNNEDNVFVDAAGLDYNKMADDKRSLVKDNNHHGGRRPSESDLSFVLSPLPESKDNSNSADRKLRESEGSLSNRMIGGSGAIGDEKKTMYNNNNSSNKDFDSSGTTKSARELLHALAPSNQVAGLSSNYVHNVQTTTASGFSDNEDGVTSGSSSKEAGLENAKTRNKRDDGKELGSIKLEPSSSSRSGKKNSSKGANGPSSSPSKPNSPASQQENNQKQQQQLLTRQEQRLSPSSLNAGGNGGEVAVNENQVYSNYIKIKCTSLVPAVGYEMTSELNVPLTLLVPARQLIDAAAAAAAQRQQQQSNRIRSNSQDSDTTTITTSTRRKQQQNDERSSSLFANPSRPLRNGGSLQAPRAVLIDRLAQASAPPTKSTSSNNNATSTTSRANSSRANHRSKSNNYNNNNNEQRAKYLEELAKQGKPATNGSGPTSLNFIGNIFSSWRTTFLESNNKHQWFERIPLEQLLITLLSLILCWVTLLKKTTYYCRV